ncbi:heme biosynthesis HemY N-terminal domain-containing protein [Ottowia sp.]|uniref:heme biosynthesis protein HemY n=1 Tax=Ottowia sp. TaxID=1898956 RepID=UPI002CA1F3C6|nr:heme biosynthesis HemY N-terminal domain-containing protein [Ottowia sp.]HOB67915.1 heme biosynthesis HemY N-terminal domain-containing protein [Ottowia sp.]HPZ56569.1 heme biosynthesis HemY N-terminal domain-containing protein [Ottowia sp.]HQD46876.1 heme biosynthesis HemY N-terminal domain-containing protein [Ottowia sp.]
MRAALWLVGLFAAAVALALFTGHNQGTLTVFWPPHRIDVSINLALLLLVGLFVLLHLALRALSAALELPRQARRWRALQRERATHALLLDAMTQLGAGRFLRARKAAEGALAREQALGEGAGTLPHALPLRTLAHITVAESAHALQDHATRDAHLEHALDAATRAGAAPELREGVLLRAARWALNQHDPAGALARLEQLPAGATRRTAALRIKLKAARQAGRVAEALDTARLLAKHGAFSPAAARSLMRGLAAELIAQAHDPAQLQTVWHSLDPAERTMPELALRAAQRLLAVGGDHALARQWLRPVWDEMLALPESFSATHRVRLADVLEAGMVATGEPSDQEWLARVEAAAQANPRDATLQYLAGMACLHRGLWGRAQLLLAQAARALTDDSLRRSAWRALARLAEQRGDEAQAAAAWKQAAQGRG